jgi:hypothetical protein
MFFQNSFSCAQQQEDYILWPILPGLQTNIFGGFFGALLQVYLGKDDIHQNLFLQYRQYVVYFLTVSFVPIPK